MTSGRPFYVLIFAFEIGPAHVGRTFTRAVNAWNAARYMTRLYEANGTHVTMNIVKIG